MSLVIGVIVVFVLLILGWILLLVFPPLIEPLIELQASTPGTEEVGGAGEFIGFILFWIIPLLWIGVIVLAALVVGGMRQEAHRERF